MHWSKFLCFNQLFLIHLIKWTELMIKNVGLSEFTGCWNRKFTLGGSVKKEADFLVIEFLSVIHETYFFFKFYNYFFDVSIYFFSFYIPVERICTTSWKEDNRLLIINTWTPVAGSVLFYVIPQILPPLFILSD